MKNEKNIGIYCIECVPTKKKYIGQSRNIKSRWYGHKSDLRANRHGNKYLQYAFNKYKEEDFIFTILEHCTLEELTDKEVYWIAKFKTHNNRYGFNQSAPSEKGIASNEYKNLKKAISKKKHFEKTGYWYVYDMNTGEVVRYDNKYDCLNMGKQHNKNLNTGLYRYCDINTLEEFKQVYLDFVDYTNKTGKYLYTSFASIPDNMVAVKSLNLITKEVLHFESKTKAAKELKMSSTLIDRVLKGKATRAKNYTIAYVEDEFKDVQYTPTAEKMIYVATKEGIVQEFYDRFDACKKLAPGDYHFPHYAKDMLDKKLSYKGYRFYSSMPTQDQLLEYRLGTIPFKHLKGEKVSKSSRDRSNKILANLNLEKNQGGGYIFIIL